MKIKRCFKSIFMIVSAIMFVMPCAQAADHYIWSNREFRFWIDDTTIEINASHTLATFDLVCENLIKHTSDRGESMIIFYKDRNQYYVTIGEITKPVNYYNGWWQPYGLLWLKDNNFLQ